MKRLISAALALSLSLVAIAASPAPVEAYGPDCSSSKVEVALYGNTNYTAPGTPSRLGKFCLTRSSGTGIYSLGDYLYSDNNTACPRGSFYPEGGERWFSCASSIKVYTGSCHWGVRLYPREAYSYPDMRNGYLTLYGTVSISNLGDYVATDNPNTNPLYASWNWNDKLGSFKIVYRATC